MLEIFDRIERKSDKEAHAILKDSLAKNPKLPKFLKAYVTNQDRIITPIKILKMMRYYGVEGYSDVRETHSYIDKIGEIGEYAAKRSELLKRKEFHWTRNENKMIVHMNNVDFLLDTIKKLKVDVSHKQQHKILKNCFVLLSYADVKWFTRFLCRKVDVTKAMLEIIKDGELQ